MNDYIGIFTYEIRWVNGVECEEMISPDDAGISNNEIVNTKWLCNAKGTNVWKPNGPLLYPFDKMIGLCSLTYVCM